MNAAIKPLASIFQINSKLLINSFKDINEELALKRPNKRTNSMMFILLHTLDARYFLLNELGVKVKNPFGKYVDWANTIDDINEYPKLKRVLTDWNKADMLLHEKLNRLTQKQLDKKTDMTFPSGKKVVDMIAYMAEHCAYHIGQLALIRKFIGMKSVTF